jgi:hypothetical protein
MTHIASSHGEDFGVDFTEHASRTPKGGDFSSCCEGSAGGLYGRPPPPPARPSAVQTCRAITCLGLRHSKPTVEGGQRMRIRPFSYLRTTAVPLSPVRILALYNCWLPRNSSPAAHAAIHRYPIFQHPRSGGYSLAAIRTPVSKVRRHSRASAAISRL